MKLRCLFPALLAVGLAQGCGSAGEVDDADEALEESEQGIRGSFPVGTKLETTADVNQRAQPSPSAAVLQVIPNGTIVASGAANPRAGWYGITWNGKTGWVDGQYLRKPSGGAAATLLRHHANGQISLWDQTFGRRDGADPLSNVRDAAAGRAVKTSCYGTAPCTTVKLSPRLSSGMVALRDRYGFRYFVTAIAGANHTQNSLHYAGRAVDVGEIDGVTIAGDTAKTRAFMNACSQLGAIEVLGPSNRADHQDHIHCAW